MLSRLSPLFPYVKRYRKSFVWGGIALIVYNAAKAMVPLLVGSAIDDMRRNLSASTVEYHALQLLGIACLSGVFLYLTRQIIIVASRKIEFDIRNDLFAHLESQPPSFFQQHRTGDIMARSTNDLSAVRQLLGPAIMYSANTIVFTAIALPFMLRISPWLTLCAFVPLPFASVLVQYFGARIHTRFERIQAMFSDISAQAEENFSGARLIRAFAQEQAQIDAFETSNREYIRRSLLLARLMAMLWPTLEFVLGISLMLTLLVGGHQVVLHRMTVGQFTSYNVYMVQLIWPMIAIGWVVNLVQRGTASVVRIDQLMQQKPVIDDAHADPALLAEINCHPEQENCHPEQENCHPERSEGPAFPPTTENRHPERSEGPAFPPTTENCHPERSEGPAFPPTTENRHPERSEGPAFPPTTENRHPERSEGPAFPPTTENRHPERSDSRTSRIAESKDPEASRATTPAAPFSTTNPTPLAGAITFNHLSFAYITGPEVLHDISLEIPAGSSLAIVGPTGSGKSTLVSLIPRLQDAAPGMVQLDGRPVRDYPLATLRRAIGFVPQETFLFSTTIADNIAFGDKVAGQSSYDEILAAATTAHIAAEILEFPRGFSTIVGERGLTLSGGQKQRTAIARAILRNPRILILDDALASVDTYTEERILTGLRDTMQGRTTLLIAHRVSTARHADRIAVLVDGRIVELGTHDQLLARGGYYSDLFEKQSLEEEIVNA